MAYPNYTQPGYRQQTSRPIHHDHFRLFAWVIVAAVILTLVILIFSGGDKERDVPSDDLQGFKRQLIEDLNPSSLTGQVAREYDLPEGYTEFCVVDKESVDVSDIVDKLKVRKSSDLTSGRNVFLLGSKGMVSFVVEDLVLPSYPYYSCVKSPTGKIDFVAENQDGKTLVKLPPSSDYCRNAQNKQTDDGESLCKYLDEVYYQGYKEGCCNEYRYCC